MISTKAEKDLKAYAKDERFRRLDVFINSL